MIVANVPADTPCIVTGCRATREGGHVSPSCARDAEECCMGSSAHQNSSDREQNTDRKSVV